MTTRIGIAATVFRAVMLALLPVTASAQGVGFVGGGTVDPEQFYVGTFFETPPIAGNLFVRPGVDGSWGNDVRIASINMDIISRIELGSSWRLYTGGGPTVLILRFDAPVVGEDRNDVTGGLSAVFGFAHRSGFLAEFRAGSAGGGSALKFGAGFKVGGRNP